MSLYYQDEFVELHLGDCRAVRGWTQADVLVTDPPYGIGWSRPLTKSMHGKSGNDGIRNDSDTSARDEALSIWGDGKPALVFGSQRAPFPQDWKRILVFEKPLNAGLIGTRIPWFNNWEPVFVLGTWPDQTPERSAVVKTSEKSASGYSGYATLAGHPHTKPQDVMTRLIEACPPGVIADPFAGSGSTLIAARNLGRRAIGVELDERYCELIVKRLSQQAFNFADLA